ncbi:MAG: hypothetical protein ACRD8W_31465 [Nitrososphaeraceae archaeon]
MSEKARLAINGFGRIGRCFLRSAIKDTDISHKYFLTGFKIYFMKLSFEKSIAADYYYRIR